MHNPICVLLVVENNAFRQTIRTWLQHITDLTCVSEARGEATALELQGEFDPGVNLLDFEAVSVQSGQTVSRLNQAYPHSKILVLSAHNNQEYLIVDLFRKGAWGYLDKDVCQPSEIIAAIRVVSKGQAVLSPSIAGWILNEIFQMRYGSHTLPTVRPDNPGGQTDDHSR